MAGQFPLGWLVLNTLQSQRRGSWEWKTGTRAAPRHPWSTESTRLDTIVL